MLKYLGELTQKTATVMTMY